MPDERSREGPSMGERIGDATLNTADGLMDVAGKRMLADAPRRTRYVLKSIPGVPGYVHDATQILNAKDKVRTGVGVAGSMAGGALGATIGGFGGPAAIATVPIGRVVGSALGEAAATYAYDHQDDVRRKLEETKRWMKDRQAQVNRAAYGFEHAFDNGLPAHPPLGR